MLHLAIDLVRKNVNVAASRKIEDATENIRRHEEAGRIMRGIDVDGAGVGTDERFEGGEIVGPGVFGFAAPFTDGGAGTFGDGERALIARCFDNDVIVGSKEGVVEEEDGFLGGGDNDELAGMNLFIDGGENFA